MAVERGARKEELRGDVLNALVRCDQGLQNIALALCKLKGGDKGIEPLAERELRNLREIGLALSRRAVRTKIIGSKRQLAGRRSVIGPMPRLPQREIAMPTNSTSTALTASSTFWLETIATAGAVTSIAQTLLMTRPMHGHRYDQCA